MTFILYVQAACGIANLLILALKDEGCIPQEAAASHIYMFDSKGLLVKVVDTIMLFKLLTCYTHTNYNNICTIVIPV